MKHTIFRYDPLLKQYEKDFDLRKQNLEEKKQQLLNQVNELDNRIAAAQSEETILQYALENGIILGN